MIAWKNNRILWLWHHFYSHKYYIKFTNENPCFNNTFHDHYYTLVSKINSYVFTTYVKIQTQMYHIIIYTNNNNALSINSHTIKKHTEKRIHRHSPKYKPYNIWTHMYKSPPAVAKHMQFIQPFPCFFSFCKALKNDATAIYLYTLSIIYLIHFHPVPCACGTILDNIPSRVLNFGQRRSCWCLPAPMGAIWLVIVLYVCGTFGRPLILPLHLLIITTYNISLRAILHILLLYFFLLILLVSLVSHYTYHFISFISVFTTRKQLMMCVKVFFFFLVYFLCVFILFFGFDCYVL